MVVSAEIRWFWEGEVPAPLRDWFETSGPTPGGGRPREDVYLRDPRQPELSLKQRGRKGGLEVKGLVRRAEARLPAGPLSGHVEVWTKWTSEALSLEGVPSIIVRKMRRKRLLDLDGPAVEEIPLGADEQPLAKERKLPEHGCTVERTEVSVQGRDGTWGTLSLEAFGPLERVEENLRRSVEHLLRSEVPAVARGAEESYPVWLARIG